MAGAMSRPSEGPAARAKILFGREISSAGVSGRVASCGKAQNLVIFGDFGGFGEGAAFASFSEFGNLLENAKVDGKSLDLASVLRV